MLFWIMCAALAVLVVGAILLPFWRRGATAGRAEPAAAYDLRVYKDQLREVERDLERGVIGPDDADRLRAEIGRKVLDADRRLASATPAAERGGIVIAATLMLALLAGSVVLYLREGAPGAPDLPIATRRAAAQARYDSRPSQAEAEAAAPAAVAPEPTPEFAALMERLRTAMADKPDDLRGLALLARNEARIGNIAAARIAQEHLIELRGDDVSGEELLQLAALMTEAAGGLITPESEALIARGLHLDPHNPQGRYMAGLLQAQNGRPDQTFPIWDQLLREGPPDAPWIGPIRSTITDLAWLAGQPNYQMPQPAMPALPPMPGPDADQIAAAAEMTPEERQEMIADMVQRLQDRLLDEGGTADEWARLVSSLKMIGKADAAAEMATHARTALAGDAARLALIDHALSGTAATAAPGPTADDIAAAAEMSPEERQKMIADMVQRLEARLATQGGTPDEWARLIGALVTVGQTDHAREIWDEAQTRFAPYPDALAQLRAAAMQAGLIE